MVRASRHTPEMESRSSMHPRTVASSEQPTNLKKLLSLLGQVGVRMNANSWLVNIIACGVLIVLIL
jgi:hypothetical protein